MKHLIATLLLVFSILFAGPSAAQNEYILTNEELIQQGRHRMAKNYATAIERVVLSLAEALRSDHSGKLYEYLSAHDTLEGLKTLEGFNRPALSLSDVEIDQYVNLGLHAVALAQGGPSAANPYRGELIVYAGREDWQPSPTGPIYMHGGVTKTDILQAGRSILKPLVGQVDVDDGQFKQANYMIRRVAPIRLSEDIIARLPTASTAAAYIPVRAAFLEASLSLTTETRRFPCADGFHGVGVIKHRETSNSINGFGDITPTHGDWDVRARNCDVDTTRTITKNDVCSNGIGATWYRITESVRKDADDPFVTDRFLDPETKEIISSTCDFSRNVQTDSSHRPERDIQTCASVYPATPAWEGDVTYDRSVTIKNIYYDDEPENFVVNEDDPDWAITREECSRLIARNIVEHKLLDCLPPYFEPHGAWRENRILRKIYREHKGGRFVLISSTPDAWRPDSNSCRNVVTTVFNEYKTTSGPCNTYILYRRSVTRITTSYQDGRPAGVITRPGGWVHAASIGKGGRRMLKHRDHGGGYYDRGAYQNNNPCGGSSKGGNSGGGSDRGGGGSDHGPRDGHSGHGEHPDGRNEING